MQITGRKLLAATVTAALLLGAGTTLALAPGGEAYGDGAKTQVKQGIDAWQKGDYGGAVRTWRPIADAGNADAQFNLGQAYRLGRGVPTDLRTAQSWFEKAAQQGHEQAQANLGLALFQNGERERALPWIRKAAESGDPRAQYVLGTAMFNGDLVPQDWPRAYALMQRAAGQGMPNAATNLEQMDKIIPLAQRQQGLALARQMEEKSPAKPAPVPGSIGKANLPPANSAIQSTLAAPAPANSVPARATPAPSRAAQAAPAPRAPVRTAAAPAVRGAGWRVQLGAFSTSANAQRQWAGLRGKVGALASLQPFYVPAGAVTRLQAGALPSRAAADKVCSAAKSAGSACFPVAP
ncbi:SPOR domain-containing protein [Sphingosinicella sp. BN140058]|uniref:SPOR domain-containing protein n=1 Tax=Sphingosinicella sp. BN140058 TaxID=1892855 RepID=UPI001010E5EF|nr:SPOR domain-containing protein [Sphingosinicella sp. BN140058]QAY79244.1 hypothetical protein ETR14_23905 [Sphingosinicella sp. BN140058]